MGGRGSTKEEHQRRLVDRQLQIKANSSRLTAVFILLGRRMPNNGAERTN